MITWTLWIHLHVMNVGQGPEAKSQVIEIKGFSKRADCEKASDAAGEIFMLRDGAQNGLVMDCKRA